MTTPNSRFTLPPTHHFPHIQSNLTLPRLPISSLHSPSVAEPSELKTYHANPNKATLPFSKFLRKWDALFKKLMTVYWLLLTPNFAASTSTCAISLIRHKLSLRLHRLR